MFPSRSQKRSGSKIGRSHALGTQSYLRGAAPAAGGPQHDGRQPGHRGAGSAAATQEPVAAARPRHRCPGATGGARADAPGGGRAVEVATACRPHSADSHAAQSP